MKGEKNKIKEKRTLVKIPKIFSKTLYAILSVICIAVTRPLAKKLNEKDVIRTNADKVISMIGVVTKEIPADDIGEVKVNMECWRAISSDSTTIKVGEKIIVNSLNGNKLLVSRTNKEKENDIKYL